MATISRLEQVKVGDLIPYELNAKKHSKSQVAKIAESIRRFGFVAPCLIDKDNRLIAGHGRLEAAKLLGKKEVPCVRLEGLTDAQRRAYIIADNRLNELGVWDQDLVDEELRRLSAEGFDVQITGFELPAEASEEFDIDLGGDEDTEFVTETFKFYPEQVELVKKVIDYVNKTGRITETFGNVNRKGNAIYQVVKEWAELQK